MRTLRLSVGLWFIAQVEQSDKAEASVCIATLELVDAWCWAVGGVTEIGIRRSWRIGDQWNQYWMTQKDRQAAKKRKRSVLASE